MVSTLRKKSRITKRNKRNKNRIFKQKSKHVLGGRKKMTNKRKSKGFLKMLGGGIDKKFEKNILLIIDPQNDFSDAKEPHRTKPGSLAVSGASADYERIIELIEKNKDNIDEIHVSLDTHTSRHIGHPAFWDVFDQTGTRVNATDEIGFSILSIDEENSITGLNIFDQTTRTFFPRKYDEKSYSDLCKYVYEYLRFFKVDKDGKFDERNKHGQVAWIWKDHCLEGTDGHKIATELQTKLDEFSQIEGKIVKYHIKGQNNLAEMYSIFSAEFLKKDISDPSLYDKIKPYEYDGSKADKPYNKTGSESYKEASEESLNLSIGPNEDLMKQLLGENNRVFICGEARTHCVKSSAIDLMEYAETLKDFNKERIVIMPEMSSPIQGAVDDLESITNQKGFVVYRENQSENEKDNE